MHITIRTGARAHLRWALLALYFLTGLAYIWVTPGMEKPDEADHYSYIRYVREHRQLPPLAPTQAGLFQSKQPPLYYVLATLVSAPFEDVPDPEVLVVQNPYTDLSVPGFREDNRNVYLHPPYLSGIVLGGRLTSLLFGTITVLCAHILARQVVTVSESLARASAAVVGVQPMFLYMSTAVNNDVALACLATATVTLLFLRRGHSDRGWLPWATGVVLGLAMILNILVGTLIGTLIPLSLKWFKADPALGSHIFVTAFTDAFGFFSFLGLATLFLKLLI